MSDTIGLAWQRRADAYARLENLDGLSNPEVIAHCNNIAPYKGMGRVNMTDNGAIGPVQNANGTGCGYDDSIDGVAANGQAMWIFPPYYYWTLHTPSIDDTYRWFISPTGSPSDTVSSSSYAGLPDYTPPDPIPWKLNPTFIRGGIKVPWIALGAFEGFVNGPLLESKVGVIPTTGLTVDQFRTAAQNRGAGWGMQDFYTTNAMQLAFLIWNGGFNSWGWQPQGTEISLGPGVTTIQNEPNRVSGVRTGWTSQLAADNGGVNLGNTTGQGVPFTTSAADGLVSPDTPTIGVQQISWYGLEGPYGNIQKFIDGINIAPSGEVWVAKRGFAEDTFVAPYVDTSLAVPEGGGAVWSADIVQNTMYDWSLLPADTSGGAPEKYLCGMTNRGDGMMNIPLLGGSWDSYWVSSLFTWYLPFHSVGTWDNIGARLMYIPQG